MVDPRLVERLQACRRIPVFSGAGVSTASGIPDFRGCDPIGQRVAFDQFEDERVGPAAVLEPGPRAQPLGGAGPT